MSRRMKILLAALGVGVLIGALYFPALLRQVVRLARLEHPEAQTRREAVQPPIATPTDVKVQARVFWASTIVPGTLEAAEIELPLSADPVLRSKQLLNVLIQNAPSSEHEERPDSSHGVTRLLGQIAQRSARRAFTFARVLF